MVIWSQPAVEDLKSAYEYIKADSEIYSNRLIELTFEKSELIERHPRVGRIVPEFENEKFRELFIYSYRLIYTIEDPDIVVVAFIHGARDLSADQFKELTE